MFLFSTFLHAGWNTIVKAGVDRFLAMATFLDVGSLGGGLSIPLVETPAPES